MGLRLMVRTPEGLVLDREVDAIRAEDEQGGFGILPGRTDLIAALPPGLLTFRRGEEEGFVALSGGLLNLEGDRCRVMAHEAQVGDRLEGLADALARERARSHRRGARREGALADLEREALRRLSRDAQSR